MTHIVKVPSTIERYLLVYCQWLGQYVFNELGAVWYCYISRLGKGKETELIDKGYIENGMYDEFIRFTPA